MATPKRFVSEAVCERRISKDSGAYAPYGPLFVSMMIKVLYMWPRVNDMMPSDEVLRRGPEAVRKWCSKLFEGVFPSMYDEKAEISWRLGLDPLLWEDASEEERGSPVCVTDSKVCQVC